VKLTPLAPRPAALVEALVRRGFPPTQADAAAAGLQPAAVMLDGVSEREREALAAAARAQGTAHLSGDGWLLLAGDAARLAGLARPGSSPLPQTLAADLGRVLRGAFEPPAVWRTARGELALDRPLVMGILNVTPDSFSDGGRWLEPAQALAHAVRLVADGADILDVGAESTRPGRPAPVSPEEEWRRLAPVLDGLRRECPATPISVDTVRADTARRALDAGACIVNDVTGLRHDAALADVCATAGCGLVLMHSRGALAELATYDHAAYDDLVQDILAELEGAVTVATRAGVREAAIALDPGFGFGKRPEQNLQLLDRLPALATLGRPLVVGPSRKRFLGAVTGRPVEERDLATAAACVTAFERGAHVFRVHAVRETREALAVANAVRTA
jgi:dihydropteroate synthase